MEEPRKHQVSLRGASAKEITREALLEKVNQERQLRIAAKRANAATLLIQRVWRRYIVTKKVAMQYQQEWETSLNSCMSLSTTNWISTSVLRPFIFFITCLSTKHRRIRARDIGCISRCFTMLLESINSTDPRKNFCSMTTGSIEEKSTWTYQAQKLISLCSLILAECDKCHEGGQKIVVLTSLALRLGVMLTDPKGWKCVADDQYNLQDAAAKDLVLFMGSYKSGLYIAIRKYINKLDSQVNSSLHTDEKLLVTTSAITLALRPFHVAHFDVNVPGKLDCCFAAEQYCLLVLTIPWLVQRLPVFLKPALKHKSVLSPCFQILQVSGNKILAEMSEMDQLKIDQSSKTIPLAGWALANIVYLVAGTENEFVDPRGFNIVDYASYVHVMTILAEGLLDKLENRGWTKMENQEEICVPYLDLLKPVCQQWHLKKLLTTVSNINAHLLDTDNPSLKNPEPYGKLALLDIAYFYSYILRIYSTMNSTMGSLPVLNMLSFTPGFLASLWEEMENFLFPVEVRRLVDNHLGKSKISSVRKTGISEKIPKQTNKDKWGSVLNKFTGKSSTDVGGVDCQPESSQLDDEKLEKWDIEPLRCGPMGISKDMTCLLYLFCATYSHLLLVLDDIEFYDKQVPYTLEKQQRIASVLNTLVYNGLSYNISQQSRPLMDSAIRCLHLMYERDCRHQFCPPDLWLSPGRKNRPTIAVAARTHEALFTNMRLDESTSVLSFGSVITTTPHVFPFEERVKMFREFVNMDKVSRKMAGEVSGPGSRSIEIVVRRGHVVEDGFQQLNSLGSRLKSSIHVSFVSESGLPEAGLDYGGLSKEFLTDISKAAFAPEYGLFSQTSTSGRHLIPNPAAKFLQNGMQMIEFLGRVVGKALYEGILLDYSFSHVFVQKLLGRYSFVDELSTLDQELYRNVMYVKHYDGDVKDLCLDFTVTEESFGSRHDIELKPGGRDTCVTNENKMQYVHAMADYKLNRQILPYSNAFYRGLTDIISSSWLKLFNASEFNQLLSGGNLDIDVDDLRNNTQYSGGYTEGSRTIKIFWEVVKGFEPEERCLLLKFVTSCSRAPLLGFKYLQPSFTIHKVSCDTTLWASIGGQDVDRLPSASTCYNTLKLPTYKRSSTLRAKLLYAISSNAGFELS
ncbi:hypothetical protein ACFE04_000480 [Oxalis oulophora]